MTHKGGILTQKEYEYSYGATRHARGIQTQNGHDEKIRRYVQDANESKQHQARTTPDIKISFDFHKTIF